MYIYIYIERERDIHTRTYVGGWARLSARQLAKGAEGGLVQEGVLFVVLSNTIISTTSNIGIDISITIISCIIINI